MRLAFFGTPDAAVPTLDALVGAGHDVVLVVTRPDRRRGRGGAESPSPVKVAAERLGLPVSHELGAVMEARVERGVVVAFGAIIPERLLERVAMLNVHFSLLPRWRGAAPVQRAILAGDYETGVSIMSLAASLDTGPIHLERRVVVGEKTALSLTNELSVLGASALLEVLSTPALLDHPRAQSGEVSYAEKITKDMLRLTPATTADVALRVVRLGGAYLFVDTKRVSVITATATAFDVPPGVVALREGVLVLGATGGALALTEVRPAGSSTMAASSWWVGLRPSLESRPWS